MISESISASRDARLSPERPRGTPLSLGVRLLPKRLQRFDEKKSAFDVLGERAMGG